ncbi:E3 ubiquitin-protein ligase RHA1B-like [Andrographis paniculata]|uniref:E3 ubiquitin-protein ligase RHA1B-like n=1 Tax=Andrographis paniculata TaxID=175694 RepID=UPI0021E7602C|nr:E3 ubiquitin-protein ligase RHA1B-like [Andrographis paniculata]
MGFYYHVIRLPENIAAVNLFLNILTHVRLLLTAALTDLGLYKPPPAPVPAEEEEPYILILNRSSPSLVPVPVRVVTAAIKAGVPVLRYGDSVRRRGAEAGGAAACSICLECIEWTDEIRELMICSHPFHRACLDRWIDAGQVNCPLCRAMLLPPKITPSIKCTQQCQV